MPGVASDTGVVAGVRRITPMPAPAAASTSTAAAATSAERRPPLALESGGSAASASSAALAEGNRFEGTFAVRRRTSLSKPGLTLSATPSPSSSDSFTSLSGGLLVSRCIRVAPSA